MFVHHPMVFPISTGASYRSGVELDVNRVMIRFA